MPVIKRPPLVDDFFAQYPDAKEVYFDEDGENVYLSCFKEVAIQTATQKQKRLFKVQKGALGSYERIYPLYFLYSTQCDTETTAIVNIHIEGEDIAPVSQEAQDVESALKELFEIAEVAVISIEVIKRSNMLEISVKTKDNTPIELQLEGGQKLLLNQTFL